MSSFNNRVAPVFDFSSDYDRVLFNSDGTAREDKSNTDAYPLHLKKNTFHIINPYSGRLAEDPKGQYPEGWNTNSKNISDVTDMINEYPRHMLKNLVVITGEDGIPMPIAGTYFMKLLDHEPGTTPPLSCVITNANGAINNLTITGNLNLSGSEDSLTAINTLGKANLIDCEYINDGADEA